MDDKALADCLAEFDGHCVADKSADGLAVDWLAWCDEFVFLRKALEDGALAKRYSSVLFWMSETSTAEAVELRCHCRRRFVPFHAPIDA